MMTSSRFPLDDFSSPVLLRVLLVEPNVLIALSIKRTLVEMLGALVEIAGSDVEATEVMRDAIIQLAIVDARYFQQPSSPLMGALSASAIPVIAVGKGKHDCHSAVATISTPYTADSLIEAIARLKLQNQP